MNHFLSWLVHPTCCLPKNDPLVALKCCMRWSIFEFERRLSWKFRCKLRNFALHVNARNLNDVQLSGLLAFKIRDSNWRFSSKKSSTGGREKSKLGSSGLVGIWAESPTGSPSPQPRCRILPPPRRGGDRGSDHPHRRPPPAAPPPLRCSTPILSPRLPISKGPAAQAETAPWRRETEPSLQGHVASCCSALSRRRAIVGGAGFLFASSYAGATVFGLAQRGRSSPSPLHPHSSPASIATPRRLVDRSLWLPSLISGQPRWSPQRVNSPHASRPQSECSRCYRRWGAGGILCRRSNNNDGCVLEQVCCYTHHLFLSLIWGCQCSLQVFDSQLGTKSALKYEVLYGLFGMRLWHFSISDIVAYGRNEKMGCRIVFQENNCPLPFWFGYAETFSELSVCCSDAWCRFKLTVTCCKWPIQSLAAKFRDHLHCLYEECGFQAMSIILRICSCTCLFRRLTKKGNLI
jgi:hypothetical protein